MPRIGKALSQAVSTAKAKASEAKGKVDQGAAEVTQRADQAAATPQGQRAKDAFERGKAVVFSREGWGVSIGVDDGVHPRRFGYGEHGQTLVQTPKALWRSETHEQRRASIARPGESETVSRTTDELGARARVFGEVSEQTLSAKLGLEGEAGGKTTVEEFGTKTETFLGARGRASAEAGPLGQTACAEVFAGLEVHKQSGAEKGGENWGVMTEQGTVGRARSASCTPARPRRRWRAASWGRATACSTRSTSGSSATSGTSGRWRWTCSRA
jgi:hypothetical protein